MLSERSHIKKTTYYRISLYEMSRIDKFIGTERRLVVSRGFKEEKIGNDCSFLREENVLENILVMIAYLLNILDTIDLYSFFFFLICTL